MRIILAIIAAVSIFNSAQAVELEPGERAWAKAAYTCLKRKAPECMIRLDHPKFRGHPKMWCPTNTPFHLEVQTSCDAEADKAIAPDPKNEWTPSEEQASGEFYDAGPKKN